ncbi:MAG: dual specificity protein phosphatase family protein [Nanoarchaeota archaeon]
MIAQLTENLFLSGKDEVLDMEKLKEFNITAILNVAYQVNDPEYKDFLMVKIGLHEFSPNPDFFKDLAIIVLSTLIDNGYKVLVHCHAGAHRSPYIAFRYLAEKQNKTIDQIYQEMMPKIPWGIIYPHQIK